MPELPEVETVARGLHKRVLGDAIDDVWLSGKKPTFKSKPAEIAAVVSGTRILGVRRMGKHIVFDLKRDGVAIGKRGKAATAGSGGIAHPQWIVHLGMTGRMVVCEPAEEVAKHTHAIAKLASGREL